MSSVDHLLDGLLSLRIALRKPTILARDEQLAVDLPVEAGRRFEHWLIDHAEELRGRFDWVRDIDDGAHTRREVVLAGVKVTWPVELIASPKGIAMRPMLKIADLK